MFASKVQTTFFVWACVMSLSTHGYKINPKCFKLILKVKVSHSFKEAYGFMRFTISNATTPFHVSSLSQF